MNSDGASEVGIAGLAPKECWRTSHGEPCQQPHQSWHACLRSYADYVMERPVELDGLASDLKARLYSSWSSDEGIMPADVAAARWVHNVCVLALNQSEKMRDPMAPEPTHDDLMLIASADRHWITTLADATIHEGLKYEDFKRPVKAD
jgi:hypothetical protein